MAVNNKPLAYTCTFFNLPHDELVLSFGTMSTHCCYMEAACISGTGEGQLRIVSHHTAVSVLKYIKVLSLC